MAPTAFFYVKGFRNDRQNIIATLNQKWQKKLQLIDG